MPRPPPHYAILRDRCAWSETVVTTSLSPESDGTQVLASVPGPPDGVRVVVAPPYDDIAPSGIAVGCHDLAVARTDTHQIAVTDQRCNAVTDVPGLPGAGDGPGSFRSPRGVAVVDRRLLVVADSGNGRVVVLRLPSLETVAIWEGPLRHPTGVAVDSQLRVYVLDTDLQRILRFRPSGAPDAAYGVPFAPPGLSAPFLAIGNDDVLYVSDAGTNGLLRFDPDGHPRGSVPAPPLPPPTVLRPRALAAFRDRLFVADATSGAIYAFDSTRAQWLGALPGYQGPVAAMTADEAGNLLVKPGPGETVIRLSADIAHVATGTLTAGPFDAGQGEDWMRVRVEARVPPGTAVFAGTFTGDQPTAPRDSDWTQAASLDTLLDPAFGRGNRVKGAARYLWIRARLSTTSPAATPRLLQIEAQTAGENYLDHLPVVYRRNDAQTGFLRRWLELFRGQIGDTELAFDSLHRRFDPGLAPQDELAWLASWMAFDPPARLAPEELREVLSRLHRIYARRGTPAGIEELIELYTGVRVRVTETFRERRLWVLDQTATLDFDTALAPALPDGMVVPGPTPPTASLQGLRADFFSDVEMSDWVYDTIDPTVDHDSSTDVDWPPTAAGLAKSPFFAVRWTGQIQAQHSEIYTFYLDSTSGNSTSGTKGGARLWVDDELVIDNWTSQSAGEAVGYARFRAGQWSRVTIEHWATLGSSFIHWMWSSTSQAKGLVPSTALYAVLDDAIDLRVPVVGCMPPELLITGVSVVGEHGPLDPASFGESLFSDTANRFTVVASASEVCGESARSAIRRIVDLEKPAHTEYQLCLIGAAMRVGLQARVGIDAIVAKPPPTMALDYASLGRDTRLGEHDHPDRPLRVGERARIGRDTRLARGT